LIDEAKLGINKFVHLWHINLFYLISMLISSQNNRKQLLAIYLNVLILYVPGGHCRWSHVNFISWHEIKWIRLCPNTENCDIHISIYLNWNNSSNYQSLTRFIILIFEADNVMGLLFTVIMIHRLYFRHSYKRTQQLC